MLVAVGVLDTWLLYRFFSVTLPALKQADPESRQPAHRRSSPRQRVGRKGLRL